LNKGVEPPYFVESITLVTQGDIVESITAEGKLTVESLFGDLLQKGLVYNFDCSVPGSVITSSDGSVQSLKTADGKHTFITDGNHVVANICHDSFNGKTAIQLGKDVVSDTNASTRLVSKSALNHQTVFLVCRPAEAQNAYASLFGADESAFSVKFSGTKVLKDGFCENGELYVNGKHSESDVSFVVGEPLVITAVNDELQLFNPAIGNVHNNTNYPARYFKGELAEIIAYNRKLSAAERKEVELHLKKKWISGVEEVSIAQEDLLVTAAEQNVGIDGGFVHKCGSLKA
jgi:hypothetical protein